MCFKVLIIQTRAIKLSLRQNSILYVRQPNELNNTRRILLKWYVVIGVMASFCWLQRKS